MAGSGEGQNKTMTERDLTRQVRDLLHLLGGWEVKVLGGLGGRRGVPDVLACFRGRFVAIEVKAPKGRLSVAQEAELEAIREAGGIAIVARELEDVQRGLREVDERIDQRVRL